MMELEKAIKILSKDTSLEAVNELKYYAGFNQDKVIEEIQEAMDIGAAAIRLLVPKEPVNKYADDVWVCPTCNGVLDVGYRCIMCGQDIKWGEADE